MANSIAILAKRENISTILLDMAALAFIYFVPTISHLLNLPVYLIEPMRVMLVLAIAHTHRNNAYILAATLPLFSFVISGHPVFFKMLLITAELTLNVWLFYFISKRMGNYFVSMVIAVIGSKLFYYGIKFLLISTLVIEGSLVSTPLLLQLGMTVVFSAYIYFIFSNKKLN